MRWIAMLAMMTLSLSACGGEEADRPDSWCCVWEQSPRECVEGATERKVCRDGECTFVDEWSCDSMMRCGGSDQSMVCSRVADYCAWTGPLDTERGCRPAVRVDWSTGVLLHVDDCLPPNSDCVE